MHIPKQAAYILQKLTDAGFEGYLVGGCVRDFLLCKEPSDFDITTSALPEETAAVFANDKVIPTGLKHGTVTVLHGGYAFEITTYRTETTYTDGRHPDSVCFSRSLADDLCRRDFTVNAMAMSKDGEIVDLYGGRADLDKKIIRAVGEPQLRFTEDALRILRAFRFASKLGFDIESDTLSSAIDMSPRLSLVSRERIFAELEKLLVGQGASKIIKLMHLGGVFSHIFDLPIINSAAIDKIDSLEQRAEVRLAALLLGDPKAARHISSLKTSQQFASSVKAMINCVLPTSEEPPMLRRAIYTYSAQTLADRAAIEGKDELREKILQIYDAEDCFSIADLKINGADVMAHTSLSGSKIGEKLKEVLFAVFDGDIPNTYDAEIALIKS